MKRKFETFQMDLPHSYKAAKDVHTRSLTTTTEAILLAAVASSDMEPKAKRTVLETQWNKLPEKAPPGEPDIKGTMHPGLKECVLAFLLQHR